MKQKGNSVTAMGNQVRNTWAKKQLTDACLKLLEEKSLEDITVSELCSEAGTGRVTFYRNYKDISEILQKYLSELNSEWTDKLRVDGSMPLSQIVYSILQHFENHYDFYALLNERRLIWMLKDVIISASHLKTDGSIIEAYSSAYVIYLLYGWIEVWFRRGMKDSSEELCRLLKQD